MAELAKEESPGMGVPRDWDFNALIYLDSVLARGGDPFLFDKDRLHSQGRLSLLQ